MIQLSNIPVNVLSASEFRCKIYDVVFKDVYNSYLGLNKYNDIAFKGGGASGKTEFVVRMIEYFITENTEDEALIVTYSSLHAKQTAKKFERILRHHGIKFKAANKQTHLEIMIGKNTISFLSIKTSSKEETLEKIKTFATKKPNALKFVMYEEFTAIINLFGNYAKFFDAASRVNREMREDSYNFYLWNPPLNKRHAIYDFLKHFEGLTIHSTIYDLPKAWQSVTDLREFDRLKRTNNKAYRHTALGEDVGEDGLAFLVDSSIWTELADNYVSFHYNTDEATANATAFALHGITAEGEVHFITNYYHSSKVDGNRHAPSYYAKKFQDFEQELDVPITTITTDGPYFAEELKTKGYDQVQSIHKIKDRALSYTMLNDLILTGRYKIVNRPENMLMYEQLENAMTTANTKGQLMVDKSFESSTNDQTKHFHLGDLALYLCLRLQKQLLMGKDK